MSLIIIGKVVRKIDQPDLSVEQNTFIVKSTEGEYFAGNSLITQSQFAEHVKSGVIEEYSSHKEDQEYEKRFLCFIHDDVLQMTNVAYWEERGLRTEAMQDALNVYLTTKYAVTGSYELEVEELNIFLAGVLVAKDPSVYDGFNQEALERFMNNARRGAHEVIDALCDNKPGI